MFAENVCCCKHGLHANQTRVNTFLSYFENSPFIVVFLGGYCTRYNIARSGVYAHYTYVLVVYLMYIYIYIRIKNYRNDGREKSGGDH